jgi:hypothetical protein
MKDMPRYWFGPRRFFWSCRLAQTWEGWLVDAILVAALLGLHPLLAPDSPHPLLGLGLVFGLMTIFLTVRSWKGDPERWDD